MIFTDRTITVRKGESRIDEPIVVYRGDYELEVRFTILNSRFKFMSGTNMIESEKASYGQLAILTPYGGNIFSDIVKCNDGSVTFVLTAEMLNQIEEVGLYSFQIRLMDYNKESRVSIPPIEFGIEVREPIASEDHDNSVNNAIVGYSIAKVVDPKEENVGDTFDESGNYNKTKWETGDRISEGKLNKIEDAIDKINKNEVSNAAVLSRRIDNNFNVLDSIIESELAQKPQRNEVRVSTEIQPINVSEMDTETKKLFTGGAVAVVDEDGVGNENLKNKSVTYQKTKGVNYFNNLNKTSNNFYNDVEHFLTNNCNLEIRNGEVYFTSEITESWLYDDISGSDEISFVMTHSEAWIKVADNGSNTFAMIGLGETHNGKILDVTDGVYRYLQNADDSLRGYINVGDEVSIVRTGGIYSVYCNNKILHSFSLKGLSSVCNKHRFGIVVTNTIYRNLTNLKPLLKEVIVKNENGFAEVVKTKLIDVEKSINKISSSINVDVGYNNTLTYDSEKVEFKFKEDNATLIAEIKEPSESTFYPCFFNKSGTMKFEFINQDTFIVLAKNESNFLSLALGDKGGTEEISGRIIKFDYNGGYLFLRQAVLEAPKLNDIITITYENKRLKLYYNDILVDEENIGLYGLEEMEDNFGVVKTVKNDISNQGLVKNVSFDSTPIYGYAKENRSRIVALESEVGFHYKDVCANFLGDSITQGVGTTKQYHQCIKEQLGLKDVRNYGIGGTCITNIESNNFISRYNTMNDDADLIVVFGGTNDFGHHMPLGDIESTDDKTFYGSLKVLCEGLINKYPGKTIIFITPLNRSCDKFPADGCPKGQKTNNLGYKLEDYVNAIKEVVPMYSMPVYDLFSNSNLYPYNETIVSKFMPDGLHPNVKGHEIMGRKIAEFIKNQ